MSGTDLDPVTLEILGHRLSALTEEMCLTLQRTSRSLYVKETADFCCALAGPDGGFVAYPRDIGVSGFVGLNCAEAVRAVGDVQPGDVIITNDPYHSGGLATHLTDIQLIEPYFCPEGRIVAYGWAFIHCSDIGGRVPSSLSPTNAEIYAEGLQIPPIKLIRGGVPDPDIERLLAVNSRTPEANLGDISAMRAALRAGRERLNEVVAAHGVDTVRAAQRALVELTADRATAALARLDNGEHRFVDYLDDDAVSNVPVRLAVTATAKDGRLHLDFTGSDPQVEAAFNVATLGTVHAWIVTRVLALICTLEPRIALNAGLLAPISVKVPLGSVVNPRRPAAVGIRHATASRVNDAVGGALAGLAPDLLPAASSGLVVPVVLAEPRDPAGADEGGRDRGGQNVQVLEPMVGGTGARLGSDGVDGRDSGISNLSNNPVETVETEIAVEILRYGLRPDSGGAGRWRGGCGLELTFRVLHDHSRLLARGLERMCFRPWGLAGGDAGAPTELVVGLGGPDERRYRKIDVLSLRAGEVVTVLTSGAGGYGDPFERDPRAVLADVERGVVGVAAAAADYGVVVSIDPGPGPGESGTLSVDADATERLRADRVTPPADRSPDVGFGPERRAWDAVFDLRTIDRLVAALFELPATERSPRRTAIYTRVLSELPAGFPRLPALPASSEQITAARASLSTELSAFEADISGRDRQRRGS